MKRIVFEITDQKTEVVIEGERTDITNTEEEKKLVATLKELRSHRMTTKILDAIDPDTWMEG